MGYAAYLKNLLLPLGVYDLSVGSVSEGELYALGSALDTAAERLETVERESLTATAEDEGLDRREALFPASRQSPAPGPLPESPPR